MKFTNKKGKIRLYDGAGTPFYLEIDFDLGDFSGPLGQAKTEEILVLDRNKMSADAHYIEGGDDKIMEPFPLTLSAFVVDNKEDTQRDGANNNPAFRDGTKLACNLEYKLDGSTDIVWHYNEVYFPLDQQSLSEAEDGVTISLNGLCYGTVVRDTAFTSGTSIEA